MLKKAGDRHCGCSAGWDVVVNVAWRLGTTVFLGLNTGTPSVKRRGLRPGYKQGSCVARRRGNADLAGIGRFLQLDRNVLLLGPRNNPQSTFSFIEWFKWSLHVGCLLAPPGPPHDEDPLHVPSLVNSVPRGNPVGLGRDCETP